MDFRDRVERNGFRTFDTTRGWTFGGTTVDGEEWTVDVSREGTVTVFRDNDSFWVDEDDVREVFDFQV